jgi:hypothetical protein
MQAHAESADAQKSAPQEDANHHGIGHKQREAAKRSQIPARWLQCCSGNSCDDLFRDLY